MLNSAEHENLSANKYENANDSLLAEKFSSSPMFSKKEYGFFSNLKFVSRKISYSAELSMKKVS